MLSPTCHLERRGVLCGDGGVGVCVCVIVSLVGGNTDWKCVSEVIEMEKGK